MSVSAPAFAAPPTVDITSVSSGTLQAGGPAATVHFTVDDTDKPNASVTVKVEFIDLPAGAITCTGDCDTTQPIKPGDWPKSFQISIKANAGAPSDDGTLKISATVGGEAASPATRPLTIQAQAQPQTVASVSGSVYDIANAQPIAGATVAMQDGANSQFTTTADSKGVYRFTGSATKPIAPGTLLLAAVKDGYDRSAPKEITGAPGQNVTYRIALKATAAPTTAAAPTAEAAAPTDTAGAQGTEAINQTNTGNDTGGGGMFSKALIGMGGLLVALGIGAIILLLVRRRDDGDGEDTPPQRVPPRAPAPRPAPTGVYRGGPDPMMVPRTTPADRTMVTRPAMGDAPTTMHRPPVDEYADQYTVRPPQPGYGAPGGYPYPSSPPLPPGPLPPGPQPPGYTGAYGSPAGRGPADPYARGDYPPPGSPAAPGYSASRGGYAGYGAEEPAHGYDNYGQQSTGYGQQSSGYGAAQSYGPAQPTGYDQSGYSEGYEPRGYDAGYDRIPEQRAGHSAQSYESQGYDGYEDDGSGSRRGAHQQPGGRAERRSLDWLDD